MSNGGNSQTEDFTGLDGNWWENRTSGINWTFHPQRNGGVGAERGLLANNRFRPRVTDYWYYSDFVPTSPDYDVEMDVILLSQESFSRAGVVGRMDTSEVTGYEAWMDLSPGSETIELRKWVNGSMTVLDSATPEPWVDDDVRRIKLEMRGTSIRMLVNGIEVCSAVDSDIAAIGRAGFTQDCSAGSTSRVHYDNWTVRDAGSAPPSLDPITDLVAVAGDGTVALSWTPPAGATSQQLHRSTTSPVPEDGSAAVGSALAGNANQTTDSAASNGVTYYYRISATDGEATVWSNEVSATPEAVDAPPVATITSPAGNIIVSPGTEIVLEGTGTDAEDGALVGEDLAWSSDVDGALGTGTQITVALSGTNESPVVHTITLTATDSAEQTGTDTVTVTVGISGSGVTRARRLQTMATLYQYDPVAARRRVPLYLEDSGGAPVTGESGTPQVSVNGGTFASTTNALVEVGSGHYYVELTAAELSTLGRLVVRYNSANTIECMTLCDVVPQVVVESGAVSSATDGQTMTVDAGLSIPVGAMVQVVTGTGAGEAGLVQSYDNADGSLVLESPGLPTTLDNTSRFVVIAAPRAGLEIDANGRVAADVEAVAGTQVASVDDFKADVSGLATAAALATVDGKVDAILVDTGTTLPAQIGALNDLSAAEVNAEVAAALADYGAATPADVAGAVADLSTFDPATDTVSVESIKAAAIAAIWSAARGDINPPAGSFGYYLDAAVSSVDGGSGGDSAEVIADAVLREALADHSGTAGSLAEALAAVHSRLTAERAAALDNLDAAVSSRLADADYTAPDNATIDAIAAAVSTVDGIVNQILAHTGTDIPAAQVALTMLAEAIKAKTDSLTFTQAGQVDANVQSINDVAITGDGSTTPFGV